jgi:hypothetical protein
LGTVLSVFGALVAAILLQELIRRSWRIKLVRLGPLHYDQESLTQAAERYQEKIRLNPADLNACFQLVFLAWLQEDYDGAIAVLNDYQRHNPGHPEVNQTLGTLHYQKGDYLSALQYYHQALELNPQSQAIRETLAHLYFELGRPAEAEAVCPGCQREKLVGAAEREALWRRVKSRLAFWDIAGFLLFLILALSVTILIACVLLGLGNLVYGFITLSKKIALFTTYGDLFAAVAKSSFIAALLSGFASGWVPVIREKIVFAEIAKAAGIINEGQAALSKKPWWKVELSGFHLLMWLGLPFLIYAYRTKGHFPDRWVIVFIYLMLGWILKSFYIAELLKRPPPDNREETRRHYNWFGTLRGTLIVSGIIILACTVIGLLFWLFVDRPK